MSGMTSNEEMKKNLEEAEERLNALAKSKGYFLYPSDAFKALGLGDEDIFNNCLYGYAFEEEKDEQNVL